MFGSAVDPVALGLAVGVFVLAVGVAWLLRRYQVTDSVGFIAVIVLPFAAYGVASGYVAKFSVAGFALELRQIATAQIKPARLAEEVEDLSIIEKGGLAALQQYRDSLEVGKPIAISLRLGRLGYYNENAIADYIRVFQPFDPNLTVIFIEGESGRFVASANGNSVLAAVVVQDFNKIFLNALEGSDLLALRRLVVLTTASVSAETTNAEALHLMVQEGVDAIIMVDPAGQATGVVRRDEIISRLMIKLAAGG